MPLSNFTKDILKSREKNDDGGYHTQIWYDTLTEWQRGVIMPMALEEIMSDDFFKYNNDLIANWVGERAVGLDLSDPYQGFNNFGDLQWDQEDPMVLWSNNRKILSSFYFLDILKTFIIEQYGRFSPNRIAGFPTSNHLEECVVDTVNLNVRNVTHGVKRFLNSIKDCDTPPEIKFVDYLVDHKNDNWRSIFAQYIIEIHNHVGKNDSSFYKYIMATSKVWDKKDPMAYSDHNKEVVAWYAFKDVAFKVANAAGVDVKESVSIE